MSDDETLCCCEYYDKDNERSHILGCCCNCVDLDEAFESVITGDTVSPKNKTGLMSTLHDRLRIPWRGGAKQISFDSLIPIFVLPVMFLLSSLSLLWTVFTFTSVLIFLSIMFKFLIKTLPKTKFFFVWTLTSGIILYCIFEFIVIPFLEILIEENVALTILICGFVLCVYIVKARSHQLYRLNETEMGAVFCKARMYNCSICEVGVPEKDHHCLWFDCCIGKHNQCPFILSLFFAIAALLYSSNLTLTSVCHPFTFYKTILLPDDCSDVYHQFELGLSFVSAIYSLFIAFLLLILFVQQLLLVSLGISIREWRKYSFLDKLCLGLRANRPYSRGFIGNWSRIVCWTRNQYSLLNTL